MDRLLPTCSPSARKSPVLLASIGFFALILAGCGTDEQTDESSAPEQLAPTTQEIAVVAEKIQKAATIMEQTVASVLISLETQQPPDGSWVSYSGSQEDLTDAHEADPLHSTLLILLALEPRTCDEHPMICQAREYSRERILQADPCDLGVETLALGALLLEEPGDPEAVISSGLAKAAGRVTDERGLIVSRPGDCASAAPAGGVDLGANLAMLAYETSRGQDPTALLSELRGLRSEASSWGEIDDSLPLPSLAYLAATLRVDGAPAALPLLPQIVKDLDSWVSEHSLPELKSLGLAGYLCATVELCQTGHDKCKGVGPVVAEIFRTRLQGDGTWAARPVRKSHSGESVAYLGSPALTSAMCLDALGRFQLFFASRIPEAYKAPVRSAEEGQPVSAELEP